MSFLEEICPSYVGEDRLRLTLADPDDLLIAFRPVLVSVDYDRALPEGVMLPLELTITAPSEVNNVRVVYARYAPPGQLAFTPREGGSHLVRLAELFHNRWWGSLVLEISGDRIRSA
jgi:hypothetical protein